MPPKEPSKFHKKPFNSKADKFLVAKGFRYSGRNYGIGEYFRPKTVIISTRKLSIMYEQRFLTYDNDVHTDSKVLKSKGKPKDTKLTNEQAETLFDNLIKDIASGKQPTDEDFKILPEKYINKIEGAMTAARVQKIVTAIESGKEYDKEGIEDLSKAYQKVIKTAIRAKKEGNEAKAAEEKAKKETDESEDAKAKAKKAKADAGLGD